jgi:ATP-dependent RNA helicase DeaD
MLIRHFLSSFFCRTKEYIAVAEKIRRWIQRCIARNLSQAQRDGVMKSFRGRQIQMLDDAARGIDVDNITHVVNYQLPDRGRNVQSPFRSLLVVLEN